ncbi:MAG: MFS transporter, partial [Dehalococcoidia bacterium]|nr:MFS transporter [Dehalococcoidia bacterium]
GRLPRAGALFSRTAALPAVINFTSSFAFAAMVSFLPLFARDRGITNPGLLFSLYAAMLLIFRLLSGRLMDTLPRHYFITPGIAALAVSLLIVASPGPSFLLFVAMGVYGVGTGAFQPAMMAYLVDRTEETVRGRALSTFTLGNDLGLSLGSFILGAIIQAADYRAAYIFGAAVAAAGAAIFALYNAREMRTAAARAN